MTLRLINNRLHLQITKTNTLSISSYLKDRSDSKCELCSNNSELACYIVPPRKGEEIDEQVAVCKTCLDQIELSQEMDLNHWRCLNESMWSEVPAVQVVAYRMLNRIKSEGWAQDAIGMMYLDEATMEWAQSGQSDIVHKDSNGNILKDGDSVTLIQDLNVKGAGFTAKRGTAVRRIRLVMDNADHIEGKIEAQHIVILTKYVKKMS